MFSSIAINSLILICQFGVLASVSGAVLHENKKEDRLVSLVVVVVFVLMAMCLVVTKIKLGI